MSIDDQTSENPPVIKSRTGKFLQGMFDKKPPTQSSSNTRSTPVSQQEFMQVVPEPITWDKGEETNWDDDFVEAPQPAFVDTSSNPKLSTAAPPPPPPAFQTTNSRPASDPLPDTNEPMLNSSQSWNPEPVVDQDTINAPQPPTPPRSTVAKAEERPTSIEVSIPRPKNIKYKSKDPNTEPSTSAAAKSSTPQNEVGNKVIDIDIQRPKNIRYKTKPPVPASLPDRLRSSVKSLFAKITSPLGGLTDLFGDRPATIYIEQVPADGTIPPKISNKKSWQLPSLASENLRQILVIAGVLFVAMTAAWAGINFWPRSTSVAVTPGALTSPPPMVQPAVPVKPVVTPEPTPVEVVKSPSQILASQYPAGLIANLELDNQQGLATVTVGDLWFSLTTAQQQQTAQSLWQQARSYQMSSLEVRVTTDRLVARSPLVGTEAILIAQ
jgi:hypothetical protein